MSGRRRRAIKAAFLKAHGRLPFGASWKGGVQVQRDELRCAKKDELARRRCRP